MGGMGDVWLTIIVKRSSISLKKIILKVEEYQYLNLQWRMESDGGINSSINKLIRISIVASVLYI